MRLAQLTMRSKSLEKYFISNRPRGVGMDLWKSRAKRSIHGRDRVGDRLQVQRLQADTHLD